MLKTSADYLENDSRGRVSLVGAGPGDAGLITVLGRQRLAEADAVVYDALVNPRLLEHCPRAELHYVGKRAEHHARTQAAINELLVALGAAGKRVVRLKGGDPFVFGRGGEECEALAAAGIAYEVVPGVTAGIAALAYAGIPITHRDLNSGFTIVTGHEKEQTYQAPEAAERSNANDAAKAGDLDFDVLAKLPCLVFYMGVKSLPRITQKLLDAGRDGSTPAATVQWGTTGRQKTVVATLATLVDAVQAAKLGAPAITVIGPVAALRDRLAWFEARPLVGKTILVTRTRGGASELADRLGELGADVLVAPLIATEPLPPETLADDIDRIAYFDWLLLTSPAAPAALKQALHAVGRDVRSLGDAKVGVVGEATAAACFEQLALRPHAIAKRSSGVGLVAEMECQDGVRDMKVICFRADIATPSLIEALGDAGADEIRDVPLYRTVAVDALPPHVVDAVDSGRIHAVLLSSGSAADGLTRLLGPSSANRIANAKVITIGPTTTAAATAAGLTVHRQADSASIESLIDAVMKSF